ncbi:MAG: glycosyltransferase family 39 protein [Actinomycetota bacterium]
MSAAVTERTPIDPIDEPPAVAPGRPSRWRRLVRGPEADPRWARPALLALLGLTALLYLWDLGASGWANGFYSAAVQAGTKSWKAFFFGSFDWSNAITVDKPPASLWVMDLSARIFGVNSWSILVPQALEGVAAVWLLYATVRRHFSHSAALLAGAVMALTPVAVLMFRFNNPDALLVLLLVGAAYAMTRALEGARTRWLVLAGALIGFAFLSKMLQAFVVVPGFALVYLVAAPTRLRRRIGQLLAAGAAMVVAAGWWVAVVQLWPAASRPYIGGSQHNSVLELIFGYNGFGRLSGNETGSVVGGGLGGGGSMWGPTGWLRMFNSQFGGQVAWLIPAALVFLGALLWFSRRSPRTDRRRAAVMLWGGWLLVTGLVFSFAKGIIHPYYAVALAPAIGALVGIGGVVLWNNRGRPAARVASAAAVAATAVWSFVLLGRSPSWLPWLRPAVLAIGLVAAAGLLVAGRRLPRLAAVPLVAAALVVALAGPAAYAVNTAFTPHAGAIPSAGPAVTSGSGGFPGPGGGFAGGPRGVFPGGFPGPPPGGFTGGPPGTPGVGPAGGTGGAPGGIGQPGGLGGLLDSGTPDSALVRLLRRDASSFSWVAAMVGANGAAGVQLAVDEPVMAIGGFNGSDPYPTLPQFRTLVRQGRVHYFVGSGGFAGQRGGSQSAGQIAAWVRAHFTARTVGGSTVYDLTAPTG